MPAVGGRAGLRGGLSRREVRGRLSVRGRRLAGLDSLREVLLLVLLADGEGRRAGAGWEVCGGRYGSASGTVCTVPSRPPGSCGVFFALGELVGVAFGVDGGVQLDGPAVG
ncbi:hypothetical protein [Planobispora takensis]|uniref:Uncharacterized protein n=1 Tax=Planobispora takensis TaxID=1367882 RepID=A0A8J3WYB1_9ACTN|nr:hypothetical protein [Planobispora takensis]GII05753.1 hypothetical protein Pta02_77610 [Planobispora takensis]